MTRIESKYQAVGLGLPIYGKIGPLGNPRHIEWSVISNIMFLPRNFYFPMDDFSNAHGYVGSGWPTTKVGGQSLRIELILIAQILFQLPSRRVKCRWILSKFPSACSDLLPILFDLTSIPGDFRRAGVVTDIPPQFGFISSQLAIIFAQLTPILPDLFSRLANLLEILSNLRLIVVAAITVTYVSPMIITAPVMASPLMTTIPPRSMIPAMLRIAPKMMTVTAPVMPPPLMMTIPSRSMFSATINIMPKMMLITAPMMAAPFAVLAILPHAILGASRRGDSWEN